LRDKGVPRVTAVLEGRPVFLPKGSFVFLEPCSNFWMCPPASLVAPHDLLD
jgi:hypothetical protein